MGKRLIALLKHSMLLGYVYTWGLLVYCTYATRSARLQMRGFIILHHETDSYAQKVSGSGLKSE